MLYLEEIFNFLNLRKNIVIASILVLFGAIYWGCGYWHHKPVETKPPVKVSVEKVTKQNLDNTLDLVGSVCSSESVAVKTRTDSQIMKINFHDGDMVEAGQVLFELDDRILKAQLQQQQAILERDQAELERATLKFERDQKLSKKGFSSSEQIDTVRQAFKAATDNVQASQAMIETIKTQLDYTVIRAPIHGRTGTINLTVGNVVKSSDSQPLVTINKITPIQVQAAIPQDSFESVRTALKNGAIKMIALNANGEELEVGTLEYRENTIDEQTRTLAVRGAFENKEEKLWPGMFVDIKLVVGADANVLTIPTVAVQNSQEGAHVFVVQKDKASKKKIKVVRIQKDLAVIQGDVQEGDVVITDGLLSVKEGSIVALPQNDLPSKKG